MDILLTNVRWLSEEKTFLQMLRFVTEERRERILRCRSMTDRARGLGAGLLLEYGLRRRGMTLLSDAAGYRQVRSGKGPYGKPYLPGEPGICFNLSHAGDYTAAVFAGMEAGIDIERIRPVNKSLADRFFAETEAAYIGQCAEEGEGDLAFTRIWTRKESAVKAAGEGMHLPLHFFCVLEDEISLLPVRTAEGGHDTAEEGDRPGTVWQADGYGFYTSESPDGYILSVCAARADRKDVIQTAVRREDLMAAFHSAAPGSP